jgi:hypothetical protein
MRCFTELSDGGSHHSRPAIYRCGGGSPKIALRYRGDCYCIIVNVDSVYNRHKSIVKFLELHVKINLINSG